MTTEFKEALYAYNKVCCDITAMEWFEKYANRKDHAVYRALKIADRLMGKYASTKMCDAGINAYETLIGNGKEYAMEEAFKAMRDQLLKEVDEG